MEPIRVAIVEDNRETRNGLSCLINGSPGFTCVAACATGEEALRVLPSIRPEIVLMDIELPGISGIDCIQRLRVLLPEAQIMMLSVFENHENIFNALRAGATGYLVKTTAAAKLLEAIHDLKNGGSPMSSQIARQVITTFHPQSLIPPGSAVLSKREQEILQLLSLGQTYKEIAGTLGISTGTVRSHIQRIYRKLEANSRTEAINRAAQR